MDYLHSNKISNEFEHSTRLINYRVQNHRSLNEKQESHTSPMSLNMAEITAMKEEQARLEEEMLKRQILEEGKRKAKENIKLYKNNLKQKEGSSKLSEMEKKIKKEKAKEYNLQLRQKAINNKKPKLVDQNLEQNSIEIKNSQKIEDTNRFRSSSKLAEEMEKEFDTFSFNDVEKEEKEPVPMSKESMYRDLNQHLNSNVVNLRDNIDKIIQKRIEIISKSDLIEKEKNNFFSDENINITEELNKNIENIRGFRKTGLFLTNIAKTNNNKLDKNEIETANNNLNQNDANTKNSKSNNELEKRR